MPGRSPTEIANEVAEILGCYVYVLVDPRDGKPFYVGKGTKKRAVSHLRMGVNADLQPSKDAPGKVQRILEIRAAGLEPEISVVRHGLEQESAAFMIEAALIDLLPDLTNEVGGHGSDAGLTTMDELHVRYGAPLLEAAEPPAMLIRLHPWRDFPEVIEKGHTRPGYGWRLGMTTDEVYASARAWWKLDQPNLAKRGIDHAVAVANGVTRAVFQIDRWIQRDDGRWAFAGRVINSGPIFDSYVGPLGKKVAFARGSQAPVTYWPRPKSELRRPT